MDLKLNLKTAYINNHGFIEAKIRLYNDSPQNYSIHSNVLLMHGFVGTKFNIIGPSKITCYSGRKQKIEEVVLKKND